MTKSFKRHVPKPAKAVKPLGPVPRANPEKAARSGRAPDSGKARAKEIGGPDGPEPTRYGDWEVKGRCIDF